MQISFVLGGAGGAPCNQTAHFSSVSEQLTPLTPSGATNCSAFVTTDFASLVATGSGIEQSIIYNAGDGWFTSTFTGTGTATITPYLDPDLTISDSNVLPITGQLTEWFGGSFNRSNTVLQHLPLLGHRREREHTLRVLGVSHANTTAAAPLAPPHSFEITSC